MDTRKRKKWWRVFRALVASSKANDPLDLVVDSSDPSKATLSWTKPVAAFSSVEVYKSSDPLELNNPSDSTLVAVLDPSKVSFSDLNPNS